MIDRRYRRPGRAMTPVLLLALLAGAGVVTAWTASTAAQPGGSVRPAAATVAVVDIERLINGLTELAERNADVRTRGASFQKELEELGGKIKSIEAALKDTIPASDTKARRNAIADLYMTKASFDSKRNGYQQLVDLENGDIIRDVYSRATTAIKAFAEREGYDMVLFDDRSIDVPAGGSLKDYEQAIQSKRILYASPTIDITDRLVTIMNNEYAASGKKPN